MGGRGGAGVSEARKFWMDDTCEMCGRVVCRNPYSGEVEGYMVPVGLFPDDVPACEECGGEAVAA